MEVFHCVQKLLVWRRLVICIGLLVFTGIELNDLNKITTIIYTNIHFVIHLKFASIGTLTFIVM